VNYVGVDVNTASRELLRFVAGVNASLARHVVAHRNEHGPFSNRMQLLSVERFGPKAFEQAAGFLRIRNGDNPLDNTAVHPESYGVVAAMAADLEVPLDQITAVPDRLKQVDIRRYTSDSIGEPTLKDILSELEKPGRDPREEFRYATFREDVNAIKDLAPGMVLEGVVTNVANFGAFVDIGVHRDGLVHVSQLSHHFVRDPQEVVKVGQVVRVRVLEVNEKLNRIGLSMKIEEKPRPEKRPREAKRTAQPSRDGSGEKAGHAGKRPDKPKHEKPEREAPKHEKPRRDQAGPRPEPRKPAPEPARQEKPRPEKPQYTVEDLMRKFNTR
jgi:protein Tex